MFKDVIEIYFRNHNTIAAAIKRLEKLIKKTSLETDSNIYYSSLEKYEKKYLYLRISIRV